MVQDGDKKEHKKEKGKWFQRRPKTDEKDEKVEKAITDAETILLDKIEPASMRGFNGFQRKLIYDHFEKTQEYKIKTYREDDDVLIFTPFFSNQSWLSFLLSLSGVRVISTTFFSFCVNSTNSFVISTNSTYGLTIITSFSALDIEYLRKSFNK